MKLPLEIREEIYGYIFANLQPRMFEQLKKRQNTSLNILLASRHIHIEASQYLYRHFTYKLEWPSMACPIKSCNSVPGLPKHILSRPHRFQHLQVTLKIRLYTQRQNSYRLAHYTNTMDEEKSLGHTFRSGAVCRCGAQAPKSSLKIVFDFTDFYVDPMWSIAQDLKTFPDLRHWSVVTISVYAWTLLGTQREDVVDSDETLSARKLAISKQYEQALDMIQTDFAARLGNPVVKPYKEKKNDTLYGRSLEFGVVR